jgi:hypothetical protein
MVEGIGLLCFSQLDMGSDWYSFTSIILNGVPVRLAKVIFKYKQMKCVQLVASDTEYARFERWLKKTLPKNVKYLTIPGELIFLHTEVQSRDEIEALGPYEIEDYELVARLISRQLSSYQSNLLRVGAKAISNDTLEFSPGQWGIYSTTHIETTKPYICTNLTFRTGFFWMTLLSMMCALKLESPKLPSIATVLR